MLADHPHVAMYRGRPKLDRTLAWLLMQHSLPMRGLLGMDSGEECIGAPASNSFRPRRPTAFSDRRKARRSREQVMPADSTLNAMGVVPNGGGGAEAEGMALPETAEPIDRVDASRILSLARKSLGSDEAWCVLYCGAIASIRRTLKDACIASKFHYAEESFDW